ncbi:lipid A biosynthesis lauroyl acyltransferase [Nitratifractor salsuginis]|nr:lipid A biosynthesis lauroyl acyltransferase [Nitratifractor salsuginis]
MAISYDQPKPSSLPFAFRILQGTLRMLGAQGRDRFASGLARLAYHLDRRHTRVARVNLDMAFGASKSDEEKKAITLSAYRNLITVAMETILLQGISKEKLLDLVEFENPAILEEAKATGRPIIFITAHYGNWELGTLAIAAKFDLPISVVGRPLDWERANKILVATREQFGVRMIPKRQAMKAMIGVMKQKGALGLVVDQNTSSKQGLLIDFFGHPARHTPSAAILARKFDAIVIPVFDRPIGRGRYRISFYDPIPMEKSDDPDADILRHVQREAKVTEAVIRCHPEPWLWLHQRWKNQYPHLYQGRKT